MIQLPIPVTVNAPPMRMTVCIVSVQITAVRPPATQLHNIMNMNFQKCGSAVLDVEIENTRNKSNTSNTSIVDVVD